MSADRLDAPPPEPQGGNRWIYWVVGGIVVVLVVIGLITWNTEKTTQEAQAKAQQLTTKFKAAGLPVPAHQTVITRTLGTDGGAVCDNAGDGLKGLNKAILFDQLVNGADFVGRRPVIVDRRVVAGEALILQTYCPDKLQEYRD